VCVRACVCVCVCVPVCVHVCVGILEELPQMRVVLKVEPAQVKSVNPLLSTPNRNGKSSKNPRE